jgi:hypothetical protein
MAIERTELDLRADLLITRELLGTAPIKASASIWWLGRRFRVQVKSGLTVSDLLALASEPGGLGRIPHTAEDLMDTWTELPGVIDIYGDRDAPTGTVVKGQTKLETDTKLLLPLAELVLSGGAGDLKPTGHGRLLEREANEYTTFLSGDGGARSQLRRMVSGPYTLLREVTDENRSDALLRVEVSNLVEGVGSSMGTPA